MGSNEASPFLDLDHPVTTYEFIKLVLLFPLALIRLISILVIFTLVWLPCRIHVLLHSAQSTQSTELLQSSRFIDWWVKVGSRALLFASGWMWITIKGKQHLEKSSTIFVYNHVTFADPVVLLAVLGGHSGIAKASVAELPFVGAISRALQYIFIQRRNSVGDLGASHRFAQQSSPQEVLNERVQSHPERFLILAPEGTTKSANCLLQFRKGAFVPGLPVMPVLLRYERNRHFNPGWGVPYNDLFHVWRLLSQVVNFVEVEFLEVYTPVEEEVKDASLYAEHVRETMASHLQCNLVEESVREENALRRDGVRPNFWGTKVLVKESPPLSG